MKHSISSATHNNSTELKETAKNSLLSARKRAIEVRHKASFGNSTSGYEFGGWKSLIENCGKSTEFSSTNSPSNEGKKTDFSQDRLAKKRTKTPKNTLCPSSQPDQDNAVVFGVVEGTVESPRMVYLEQLEPLAETVRQISAPIKSTEMLRLASPCIEKNCLNFDGKDCSLVTRIVEQLTEASETLPACQIRSNCRWWYQEGKSACLRCPQVVTENYYSSSLMEQVAVSDAEKVN